MHLRFSTAIGTPVLAEQEEEVVGRISDLLVHPDTGRVEGFFVRTGSFLIPAEYFLSSVHILSWGTMVRVRSAEYVSPPGEILRLRILLADPRYMLGQKIVTADTKRVLGRCSDLQFDTKTFRIEWLFPRTFLWLRTPVAASEIVEVTARAIIVRDPVRPEAVIQKETAELPAMPEVLSPVRT